MYRSYGGIPDNDDRREGRMQQHIVGVDGVAGQGNDRAGEGNNRVSMNGQNEIRAAPSSSPIPPTGAQHHRAAAAAAAAPLDDGTRGGGGGGDNEGTQKRKVGDEQERLRRELRILEQLQEQQRQKRQQMQQQEQQMQQQQGKGGSAPAAAAAVATDRYPQSRPHTSQTLSHLLHHSRTSDHDSNAGSHHGSSTGAAASDGGGGAGGGGDAARSRDRGDQPPSAKKRPGPSTAAVADALAAKAYAMREAAALAARKSNNSQHSNNDNNNNNNNGGENQHDPNKKYKRSSSNDIDSIHDRDAAHRDRDRERDSYRDRDRERDSISRERERRSVDREGEGGREMERDNRERDDRDRNRERDRDDRIRDRESETSSYQREQRQQQQRENDHNRQEHHTRSSAGAGAGAGGSTGGGHRTSTSKTLYDVDKGPLAQPGADVVGTLGAGPLLPQLNQLGGMGLQMHQLGRGISGNSGLGGANAEVDAVSMTSLSEHAQQQLHQTMHPAAFLGGAGGGAGSPQGSQSGLAAGAALAPPASLAGTQASGPSVDDLETIVWDDMFRCLLIYKRNNGHTNIPSYFEYMGRKVGEWCKAQQYEWCPNITVNDYVQMLRFNKLKAIGFDLDPDWNILYDELISYIHDCGSRLDGEQAAGGAKGSSDSADALLRIPVDYKQNGHSLGLWVNELRREYRYNGTSTPASTNNQNSNNNNDRGESKEDGNGGSPPKLALAIERIQKLRDIGFVFDPDWMEMFYELQQFYTAYRERRQQELGLGRGEDDMPLDDTTTLDESGGYPEVPDDYVCEKSDRNLSQWIFEQRWLFQVYNRIPRTTISQDIIDDRISLLESIHFDFALTSPAQIAKFEDAVLEAPDRDHGNSSHNKITLWDSGIAYDSDEHWDDMYTGVILFKDIKGHLYVPEGTLYNGESLRNWVSEQKQFFEHCVLTEKSIGTEYPTALRFVKLEAIGFDSLLQKSLIPQYLQQQEYRRHHRPSVVVARVEHPAAPSTPVYEDHRLPPSPAVQQGQFSSAQSPHFSTHPLLPAALHAPQFASYDSGMVGGPTGLSQQMHFGAAQSIMQPSPSPPGAAQQQGTQSYRDVANQTWQTMYDGCVEYLRKHKHLNMPKKFIHDGKYLNQWMSGQRKLYEECEQNRLERTNSRNPLSEEQIEKLRRIGIIGNESKGQTNGVNENKNGGATSSTNIGSEHDVPA